jgi:hypothetical protein
MYHEAIAEFEKQLRASRSLQQTPASFLGIAYALTGRRVEAEEALENVLKYSKTEYVSRFSVALLHFALGKTDEGFEWLNKGYEDRDHLMSYLKVNPVFELLNVTSDKRYQELLKKMGLYT